MIRDMNLYTPLHIAALNGYLQVVKYFIEDWNSNPNIKGQWDWTCLHAAGERAKRARRYLVMFMEARDIYIFVYICLFLIRMCASVFCELNSRAKKWKTF